MPVANTNSGAPAPHKAAVDRSLPIGVFDSGLGGLTVVRALGELLPGENIIYLGDSARVPYGTRSAETVVRYAEACARFLVSRGLKMLVVACNTASAVALPALRQAIDVPVLGVISAGAVAATTDGQDHRVGVIGTAGTINSKAYVREIQGLAPGCSVFQQPAPLLVPRAEEGWTTGQVPGLAAARYIEPLVNQGIDVLLLGCTHYPLLVQPIQQALSGLGSSARIIDSATAMATQVARSLEQHHLLGNARDPGTREFYVTDMPGSFEDVASRFLGTRLGNVQLIDIS